MKISDAKAALEKKNGKSSKRSKLGSWVKSRAKGRLFWKHREKKSKVHFASLMDLCHLKNAELEQKFQRYKGRVVLRGDSVKDDSGAHAVFHWTGLVCVTNDWSKGSWCHCKTTRLWRTSNWCSICLNQRMQDTPRLLRIPKSECPDVWIRLPRPMPRILVKHWRSSGSSWTKFVRTPTCSTIVWKTVRKKFYCN